MYTRQNDVRLEKCGYDIAIDNLVATRNTRAFPPKPLYTTAFRINRLDLFNNTYTLLTQFVCTVLTSLLRNNALVACELPCPNLVVEHLINFFKRAILSLRNEEEDEDCGGEIRHEPDVAVLGTPVEIQGIDEVWSSECADPTKQESRTGA